VVSPAGGGEDIDTILAWYTGSEDTKSLVEDANRGVNLAKLHPGQHILIPRAVVTQTNPLPRKKFSFDREGARAPNVSAPPAPSKSAIGKKADPLEELLSQQESRQARKGSSQGATKMKGPIPETFDIEEERSVTDVSAPVGAKAAGLPQQKQAVKGAGSSREPLEIDAVLKREQAEVDKLRQELAPEQEVPLVDPDEHLP
jgi:hypothetical protein